jgi:hypothetical protein
MKEAQDGQRGLSANLARSYRIAKAHTAQTTRTGLKYTSMRFLDAEMTKVKISKWIKEDQ